MVDDKWICSINEFFRKQVTTLTAAVAFYTCLPVPFSWTLEFYGIARFAPIVGVAIGWILGLMDGGLQLLGMPQLTRSVLVVLGSVAITGGLHLDGAMDAADGLGVSDPQRRLEVMADSRTGAFGAIAAIAILLLKTAALTDLQTDRGWVLMAIAGWGRWGQLVAIARYPYLRATGKGAFHKEVTYSPWDFLPGLLLLVSLSILQIIFNPHRWLLAIGTILGGGAISILTGAWFHRRFGGHTGDTYGAVVEWTEALLLCLLVSLKS